jgi:hypothetical protein
MVSGAIVIYGVARIQDSAIRCECYLLLLFFSLVALISFSFFLNENLGEFYNNFVLFSLLHTIYLLPRAVMVLLLLHTPISVLCLPYSDIFSFDGIFALLCILYPLCYILNPSVSTFRHHYIMRLPASTAPEAAKDPKNPYAAQIARENKHH